jgi:hypothetical protein
LLVFTGSKNALIPVEEVLFDLIGDLVTIGFDFAARGS